MAEIEQNKSFTKTDYDLLFPILEALREEVSFILNDSLNIENIKIHTVESRVKDYLSLNNKINEKVSERFTEITDKVGARVVCLFKSDIAKIGEIIESKFEVLNKDDKLNSSADSFGYMSIHYVCLMKGSYRGPRYNRIKNIKFEIQVRTICMHAWAAISHYLDYKSEWDIPEHLRKGLNALSGLFYVADEQYERLYDARQQSRHQADRNANALHSKDSTINLDTLSAYLMAKFPDRRISRPSEVSHLISELTEAGYDTISKLDLIISATSAQLREDEIKTIFDQQEKNDPFYSQAGAVRVSLSIADPAYKNIIKRNAKNRNKADLSSYDDLLPP